MPPTSTYNKRVLSDPYSPGLNLSLTSQGMGTPQEDPSALNAAMMQLLRRYQQQGRQTMYQAQGLQADRTSAMVSPDLIGASPSIQSSVRNASVNAVEPTIGGARNLINEAGDLLTQYKTFEEGRVKTAQALVSEAIKSGSKGLRELIKTSPDIIKTAGYDAKTLDAISMGLEDKEGSDISTQVVDINGSKVLINSKTGDIIKTIGGGGSTGGTPISISSGPGSTAPSLTGTVTTPSSFVPRGDLTEKEQGVVDGMLKALPMIDQIEALYKQAVGEEYTGPLAGVGARFKGIGRAIGRGTGLNENSKKYKNFVESNLSLIARGLKGETGVLTNQDIARARGAIPTGFSSPSEAQTAFATLKQQIYDNMSLYGKLGSGGGGRITVSAPNGKTYTFSSQEQADAFKRAAKIQ